MSFTANPNRWWGCASAFKPKSCQADGLFDVVVFVRQYLKGRVFRRTAGPLAAATTTRRHLNGSVFRQTQSPVWRRGRCARAFRRNCFQTDRRLSQRHRRCCGGGGHVLGWLRFQACLLAQHCPLCSSSLGSPASQALSPWQPEPDSTDSPFSEASVLPPNGGIWEAQAH